MEIKQALNKHNNSNKNSHMCFQETTTINPVMTDLQQEEPKGGIVGFAIWLFRHRASLTNICAHLSATTCHICMAIFPLFINA